MQQASTVISGSFRKNMVDITRAINSFDAMGVSVLAPKGTRITGIRTGFTMLATDSPEDSPLQLERAFMDQIANADFLYVVNTGGYIGKSASAEMAHAKMRGIPIITSEKRMVFSQDVPVEGQDTLIHLSRQTISIDSIPNYQSDTILGLLTKEPTEQAQHHHLEKLVNDLLDELSTISQ